MSILVNFEHHCNLSWIGANSYTNAQFGAGTGPIVMNSVQCNSSESKMMDCPFSLNHNCSHHEDAGVRCVVSTYGKLDVL